MKDWGFGDQNQNELRIPFVDKVTEKPRDPITEPEHYSQGAVDVIDVIMLLGLDPCAANVLKYISRHQAKGRREDLRKAAKYIELMLLNYDRWYGYQKRGEK
jgi:hypothetical protein